MKLDFDAIAEAISPEQFAHAIGARKNGTGYHCPNAAGHPNGDRNPSLSISRVNGRTVAHCHGCDLQGSPVQVASTLWGMTTDAAAEKLSVAVGVSVPRERPAPKVRKKRSATYDYTDEDGILLFQAVRYEPKDFSQRRPDGNGGWIYSVKDVRRVLYRLPEVLEAVSLGKPIYLCAGEKDVAALRTLGAVATCNPMGEGKNKWRPEFSETLRGADVIMVADKDLKGRGHARRVSAALAEVGATVRVMEAKEGNDAHDHVQAGYGLDDLVPFVDDPEDVQEEVDLPLKPPEAVPELEHCTDLGNARRFARACGEKIRYCGRLGGFKVWDERRWLKDELRLVELYAKGIPAMILEEASRASDSALRKELATHALRCESEARLKAMISLVESEPEISTLPKDFDSDPFLFNVLNGTLDLRTGQLLPHDRANLITKVAPVKFDPQAQAPTFERFLSDVVTPPVADYLKRTVGLSMIGEVREHVLLFLFGTGANGKSTLLRILQAVFGDYAKQADPELLLVRRNDAHPTGVADLFGSRLMVTTEVADGRRLAEALVKQLTGGDRVKARFMHRDFFEFDPTWTIWMAANHKPTIRGTDDGIWRRIRLIPFEVSIPQEDQDEELVAKLQAELPGILNWALEGCLEYLQNGLQEPVDVLAATNCYRAESDAFRAFLDDETEPGEWVESSILYSNYKSWCDRSGERALSQRKFGQALGERGLEKGNHPDTRRVIYLGITLLNQASETFRKDQNVLSIRTPPVETYVEKVSEGFGANDCNVFLEPPEGNQGELEPIPAQPDLLTETDYETAERTAIQTESAAI